ncbi:14121_t:CDS:2 [Funneliformis caledonium]|uniref:14121_t:CDS:1 n=1 Tax=Funneliformis caledonium TaxID=1117310 RepID=A0A9N9GQZ2_9GLOM|nr:14121_t:CDS:2 [Funneliformis caledonium]
MDIKSSSEKKLENSINNKEIILYNYENFNDVKKIGSGAAASVYYAVYYANWKSTVFAIKKFHELSNMKEIINEIDIMKNVRHPNIIRLCGVTKTEVYYTKHLAGVVPYMDPNFFNNNYKLTKECDIYSLGVLFWELTSRSPPFDSENNFTIEIEIFCGKREEPIPHTNYKFVKLYQECWKLEQYKRPNIQKVLSELNQIATENNNAFSITDSDDENGFHKETNQNDNVQFVLKNESENPNENLLTTFFIKSSQVFEDSDNESNDFEEQQLEAEEDKIILLGLSSLLDSRHLEL